MNVPPLLVSILEGALSTHATHIDIDPSDIVLWRDDVRLGVAALPPGTFPHVVTILRGLASMTLDAVDGRTTFHGPRGPLSADIHFGVDSIRLTFSKAKHLIDASITEGCRIGASRVVIESERMTYWKGSEMIAVAHVEVPFAEIVREAKALGATAVVLRPEGPMTLRVDLGDTITLSW